MREILFRGKRTDNGKWVEGEMLHDMQDRPHLYWKTPKELPIVFSNHAIVDPGTLGQFTGLTDRNGVKIFEGDIVKHYFNYHIPSAYSVGQIFWNAKKCRWSRTATDCDYFPEVWSSTSKDYEVIGNIHDNPELVQEVVLCTK